MSKFKKKIRILFYVDHARDVGDACVPHRGTKTGLHVGYISLEFTLILYLLSILLYKYIYILRFLLKSWDGLAR
jgi:hypothetical protein